MNAEVCWEVGGFRLISHVVMAEKVRNFALYFSTKWNPEVALLQTWCPFFLCEKHRNYRLSTKIAATCDTTINAVY